MSTPAAKRRRVEAASTTLSKPFKSPFKTSAEATVRSVNQSAEPHETTSRSHANHLNTAIHATTTTNSLPTLTHTNVSGYNRKTGSKPMSAALNADPTITQLTKTQRELENLLRESREQLDIAKQALKIETDAKNSQTYNENDGELRSLIQKWKTVSRAAAEDLFTGIRERVNRMGGPKAWREAKQRQQEFLAHFNDEPLVSGSDRGHGESNDYEQNDHHAYDVDEPETANEKAARCENDTSGLEDDEDVSVYP